MICQLIILTAAFFAALTALCMRVRVGSAVYRVLARGVQSLWMLIALSAVPGMTLGVNLLNIAAVSLLGAPGAILMQVIALMP